MSWPWRQALQQPRSWTDVAPSTLATKLQSGLVRAATQGGSPWFLYAFGAAGTGTTVTGATALVGTALRSPGCLGVNVFLMCLLLTGQACLAVAFFVDTSWTQLLPPESSGDYEAVKAFITSRLAVCKWVGVGLFLGQLLTTLASCMLQSVYTLADEAAEDEEEVGDGRAPQAPGLRQPLLFGQQPVGQRASISERR